MRPGRERGQKAPCLRCWVVVKAPRIPPAARTRAPLATRREEASIRCGAPVEAREYHRARMPTASRAWVLSVVGLLGACEFSTALPVDRDIRCADGASCPAGYACRRSVGRCFPVGQSSGDLPQLVSATVSPRAVRHGELVRVELRASGPLAAPPRVNLIERVGVRTATLLEQASTAFSYTYRADRDVDSEGVTRVEADLVDVNGLEAFAQTVGLVEFDFTPPTVLEAVFTAPRAANDAGVLVVREGESATLRVTTSEPSLSTVQLVGSSTCDGGMPLRLRYREGVVLEFASSPLSAPCEVSQLSLQQLSDVVGNVAEPVPLGHGLSVDAVPPVISNLTLSRLVDGGAVASRTFSHHPGFDRYRLTFELDSSAVSFAARLDGVSLPSCSCAAGACRCEGVLPAGLVEGAPTFVVTASDAVGNLASASVVAQVDLTGPRLVPEASVLTLTPPPGCPLGAVSALGVGGRAQVSFTVDEPVERLSVSAGDAGLVFTAGTLTPTFASFSAVVTGAAPTDGTWPLFVTATDLVGNTRVAPLGLDVVVDTSPPTEPSVGVPGAVVYRRAPWGSRDAGVLFRVTGAPGSVSPGAFVQVLDGVAPLALVTTDGGAFSATLPPVDRVAVAVRALDAACNGSAAVRVRQVEWLASLEGKVMGRDFENPHASFAQPAFTRSTEHALWAREVSPSGGMEQVGRRAWEPRRLSAWPLPSIILGRLALVYDALRQRAVFVEPNSPLWEWNGRSWDGRMPSPRPAGWPFMSSHTTAYDAVRGTVLLYGEPQGTNQSALWEWDGHAGTWVDRTPAQRPAAWPPLRTVMGFTCDARRRRCTLFTGSYSLNNPLEVWDWNGATGEWTLRSAAPRPTPWPSAAVNTNVVEDARRGVLLFIGGGTPTGTNDGLWEWNGSSGTWAFRGPVPTVTQGASLAYDAATGVVFVFGGRGPTALSDELWEWEPVSGAWTNRTVTPRPPAWPSPRQTVGLTVDVARRRLLVLGGNTVFNGGGTSNELWELDLATMTWANRVTPTPSVVPPGRMGHSLAYDSDRQRVLLFGGNDAAYVPSNDFWEWDGQRGSWARLTPTPPSPQPTGRLRSGMVYDRARRRTVVFGGLAGSTVLSDVWEWDASTNSWTNRTPTTLPSAWPPAQGYPNLVYDEVRQRVRMTRDGLGDVWEWDGAAGTWSRQAVSGPAERGAVNVVFDAVRGCIVAFGGRIQFGPQVDETWDWCGSSGWSARSTAPPKPLPRAAHALVFDGANANTVLFGGNLGGIQRTDDVWSWDGALGVWTEHSMSPRPVGLWPPARDGHAMVFDSARGANVLYGGYVSSGPVNEVWDFLGDTTSRPGLSAQFSFAEAGAEPVAIIESVTTNVSAGGTDGAGADGVELLVSHGSAVVPEHAGTGSFVSPSALTWETTAPTRLTTLFEGPQQLVRIAVTPTGSNRPARLARVRLEWVDLLVRYRLP